LGRGEKMIFTRGEEKKAGTQRRENIYRVVKGSFQQIVKTWSIREVGRRPAIVFWHKEKDSEMMRGGQGGGPANVFAEVRKKGNFLYGSLRF